MVERSVILRDDICAVVEEVTGIMNETLNTNFTFDEIVNSALMSFINKTPYVSIFCSLTGKVKYTFDDVFKLQDMSDEERDSLEFLISAIYRDSDLKQMVSNIQLDVDSDVQSKHTENQIQELYELLREELDTRKKGKVYRSGYKRLIIKSAIVALVRRNNSY